MDCLSLIRRARELGLRITTDGFKLSVRGPAREKAFVENLLARKIEVIEILQLERQKCKGDEPFGDTPEYQNPAKDDSGSLAESAAGSIQESGQDTLQKVSQTHLTVDRTDESDTTALAPGTGGRDGKSTTDKAKKVPLWRPGVVGSLALDPGRIVGLSPADPGTEDSHCTPLAPERRLRLEAFAAKLDGVNLFDLAHNEELAAAERDLYRDELLSRADAMIAESEGLVPHSNQGVWDMFAEARERFGYRAVEENCITTRLRKHAPTVAALWPDAPPTASWLDWRRKTGSEHMAVSDQAFAAVTKCSTKSDNRGSDE